MSLRAFLLTRAVRFRAFEPRPMDAPRVSVVGVDPVRVLVVGAGLAAGFGVTRQDQAIAGTLATRLAEASGRGVIVDIRAAPMLRAAAAVDFIGLTGTHSYHAAIFAPCHLEATFAPGTGIVRHGRSIQDHLLTTGSTTLRLIMLGVPRPSRFTRLDITASEAASKANLAMRAAADSDARVTYVDPPAYESVQIPRAFDARYYSGLGAQLADELLAGLGYSVTFARRRRFSARAARGAGALTTVGPVRAASERTPVASDVSSVSYSRRVESPADVVKNRVSITASLFAGAMSLSLLLGRDRGR